MRRHLLAACAALTLLLAACGSPGPRPAGSGGTIAQGPGDEVALYALGLIGTSYRFGGKNPEDGFDCSGMVAYIYDKVAGIRLGSSAADIVRGGRSVERAELRPGDLVFFQTGRGRYSHVGIYLGETRFVHAPSSNGRVRIDRLDDSYFAQRYVAARTYFD